MQKEDYEILQEVLGKYTIVLVMEILIAIIPYGRKPYFLISFSVSETMYVHTESVMANCCFFRLART